MASFAKKTIEDIDVQSKRVLMRVDFNVPVKDGTVTNDKRLRATVPTIQYLLGKGARLVLMSHLGRPKGQKNDKYSLKPVVKPLSDLLGKEVKFIEACVGDEVVQATNELKDGEILLLENLRFHAEEEKNDSGFAKELAKNGDVYADDAFGTSHRAHASTEGVPAVLKPAVCGYLLKKEIQYLGEAVANPAKPFVAIIGGAKISGKIDVIEALLPKVDHLLIGGAMMFTFYKAKGYETGKSLVEDDKVDLAKELLEKSGGKIILPSDCMVSDSFNPDEMTCGPLTSVKADSISATGIGLDIGPDTISEFQKIVTAAKTVVWNGPMGVFEISETAKGTFAVGQALAEATSNGAVTIVGGGDSVAAIEKAGLEDKVSHVSTGGGASLEFLEGKTLPGVDVLDPA